MSEVYRITREEGGDASVDPVGCDRSQEGERVVLECSTSGNGRIKQYLLDDGRGRVTTITRVCGEGLTCTFDNGGIIETEEFSPEGEPGCYIYKLRLRFE